MVLRILIVVLVLLLGLAFQAILQPPPQKLCGSPGGPTVTSPRIKLRDGRYLAFDRAGYGKSDPNLKRDVKSDALDIEELADQLEPGQKFNVLGVSMGGYSIWGCLQYIPNRLAGAALVVPIIIYWWPSFPDELSKAHRASAEDTLDCNCTQHTFLALPVDDPAMAPFFCGSYASS